MKPTTERGRRNLEAMVAAVVSTHDRELALLQIGSTLAAGVAWSHPDMPEPEIRRTVASVLEQVREAIADMEG